MIPFRLPLLAALLPLAAAGCTNASAPQSSIPEKSELATAESLHPIVAMRRITEQQYRNIIADIFGADIKVAGRFEPIVRPQHQLIATGASGSTISPSGLEQFDAIARSVAAQVFAPSRRPQVMRCAPADPKAPDQECARRTLTPIARYLFRRPVTSAEQAAFINMAALATRDSGSFYTGLELAVASMMVSPNFLYVVESAEPVPGHPGELRLDSYSRASRLSFLLWNTSPNDALLAAAEKGRLTDSAQLQEVAARMIASERFSDGVRAFFSDMLLFEKFDEIAKDPVIYPRFNSEVARDLPEQMLRTIVNELVVRSSDYRELFTSRRTVMTRALGPVYRVQVKAQTGWEQYDFPSESDRGGLLSQAGFLALYSHSGRSSPTLRGRAVRELLMCEPVPNPPGNVNFTAVQDVNSKIMRTARMRLTAHNTDPVCTGCHQITDPIGLPLERFDGIGAFRSQENETAIDASGTFEGQPFIGAKGLGKALASSPATTQCVASRAIEYATGRASEEDVDLISALNENFATNGYRLAALFLRVATMPEAYRVPKTRLLQEPSPIAATAARTGAIR